MIGRGKLKSPVSRTRQRAESPLESFLILGSALFLEIRKWMKFAYLSYVLRESSHPKLTAFRQFICWIEPSPQRSTRSYSAWDFFLSSTLAFSWTLANSKETLSLGCSPRLSPKRERVWENGFGAARAGLQTYNKWLIQNFPSIWSDFFRPGKHVIQFLAKKMQHFQNVVLHDCILIFDVNKFT